MAQPFRNQCAALRIKPNSSILEHEAELREAESVDLTNNYLGGTGVQALTDILRHNTKIHSLNLHSNGLSNEAVVFLCRALHKHPSLKFLDLSGNPISLPAGLALLQYVHGTTSVEEIKLDGTLVDDLVVRKINRSININRNSRNIKPAPAVQATLANINAEFAEKREVKHKAHTIRSEVAEQLSGSSMRDMASRASLPMRDPESGWLVINVYASTTPGDFHSELEILANEVIPKLNDTFFERKTHFVLSSLYHGLNTKQRSKLPKTCHADVRAALNKAPTVFLQFLGDKVGEFADSVAEQTPLQDFERENTPAAQRGMCLYCVRQCSKLLKMPAALMPLFSDDPQMVFPDATTSIVRNALMEARHISPPQPYDPKVASDRWVHHVATKNKIIEQSATYPSMQYTAEFDKVDTHGNIYLKKLEVLSSGLTRRLTAFVDLLLSRPCDVSLQGIQRAIGSRCAILPGRKSLTGKLDLYCVTPPSRNALLLAHEPGAGATTLLAALNTRLEQRPGFIVASHYVREPVLAATSRDAKTMFLSLTQSLLAAQVQMQREAAQAAQDEGKSVPPVLASTSIKSAITEDLSAANAKSLFITTLQDVATEAAPKNIVVVILVDAVDCIEFPENPCDALRKHEATGADEWSSTTPLDVTSGTGSSVPSSSSQAASSNRGADVETTVSAKSAATSAPSSSSHQQQKESGSNSNTAGTHDDLDWIPTCLGKNVRFVLSCQAQSRVHQMLEVRGHDSCDVVTVPELGDADFEAIMHKQCELNNIEPCAEVDLAAVRANGQFRTPQYLQFVTETLITAHLNSHYMKRSSLLQTMPDNLDRCCDALLDRFESEFGQATASLVSTTLACCSRSGGMLDVHLRELIQRSRVSRGSSSSSSSASVQHPPATLLNASEFERILRILRPVLDSSSALVAAMCNTGANPVGPLPANLHIVNVRSSYFVDCVRRRYLPTLEAAAAAHKHVAHFYLRHCDHNDPFQLQSLRAATFHAVEANLWDTVEERILTLPFLAHVMRRKQAAPVFNVLVRAFNILHPVASQMMASAAGSAGGSQSGRKSAGSFAKPSTPADAAGSSASLKTPVPPSAPAVSGPGSFAKKRGGRKAAEAAANDADSALSPQNRYMALLQLLREYIYYIRKSFRTLGPVPHLAAQLAILLPVDSALHVTATEILTKRRVPRLVPVLGRTRNTALHHGLISGTQFTPSGLRIATGSHDGHVKVCNVMGEVVHSIRDGAAKVLFIKYSTTSRYLVAACENHVILVIDAASGNIVSKIQGHIGAIKCLNMTARGRNVLAGYEDRDLWVWDSETARRVSTVGHQSAVSGAPQSPFGGVNGIIPHPTDERIVYTICERRLIGSRILHAEEGQPQFESLLNIVGHNSLPLAADSCFVVADGTFALLCAKDLVMQPPSFVRSEANIKVFSLQTGRMIAALAMEMNAPSNRPSAVACVVSPDERYIVAGALDGAMRVYQPDWRTYSTIDDAGLPEPTTVRPIRVLSGFHDTPPRIMRFAFDSKSFLATADNLARIWPVHAGGETNTEEVDGDGMLDGFDKQAKIEFAAPGGSVITCGDWSPNPSDDGAQIVLGDDRGKLYCLREQV